MNYIKKLEQENDALRATLHDIEDTVAGLLIYYRGKKFQGFDNDFAHVSTDLIPRLQELRSKINYQ